MFFHSTSALVCRRKRRDQQWARFIRQYNWR